MPKDTQLQGAIWGQFVGDAAALGSHWIYDLSKLDQEFPGGVQGFETPKKGHYHFGKKTGDQTHYGDGALVLLESIAKNGKFSVREFGQTFVTTFEEGKYMGYRDKATRETVNNYRKFTGPPEHFDFQQGTDDYELATGSRLASLVVRYYDSPDLLSLIEQATRVCQNNDRAVAYMKMNSLLLLQLLDGHEVVTAVQEADRQFADLQGNPASQGNPSLHGSNPAIDEVRLKTKQSLDRLSLDVTKATLSFAQSCPLPGSYPSTLHAFLKYPNDFQAAILATLRAGGDSAGRAAMLGAWLGAHLGMEGIPENWRTKLNYKDRISKAVDAILAQIH